VITGLNHITLAVRDIDQSFAFYRDRLGFKPLVKWENGAYFLVGDFWFCLNVDEIREPNLCGTHYAFTVSPDDFRTLSQRLIDAGAYKENTSEGDSLYFLDPDGHKLEIHVGDWQTRVAYKKEDIGTWENVEWFV
jgi:catechol 2,3-dioxygenase-like lactoylglutathione lyase family enzyme